MKSQYQLFSKIIIIILIINAAIWLMSPIPDDGDSYLYANIVKELANSNHWYALTYNHQNWLDKPHFPFWIGAICFKLLGSNMISYNISGFIFYLIGGYFCYKLAQELYNKPIALTATIIYFSITRIAISAIYIRAEIFLLAELTAVAYYSWQYEHDHNINLKHLFGLSLFSAMAIMTKGIFIVISIFGSILILSIQQKQYCKLLSIKYLLSYLMIAILCSPEIIALYLQFDAHPHQNIQILHQSYQNVSAIKWFFWDSQFGRFFNNSYITHDIPVGGGYFYFIPIFLEFFLPWSLLFLLAIILPQRYQNNLTKSPTLLTKQFIFLISSFLILFVLFSISKFQASLYIVILFSFPAIIVANSLHQYQETVLAKILQLQKILLLLILSALPIILFIITHNKAITIAVALISSLAYYLTFLLQSNLKQNFPKLMTVNVVIFMLLYNGMMIIKNTFFIQHNIGREIQQTLLLDNQYDSQQNFPIFYLNIDSGMVLNELLFHTNRSIKQLQAVDDIKNIDNLKFYLLIPTNQEQKISTLFPTTATMINRYQISRFHGFHKTEQQLISLFRIYHE